MRIQHNISAMNAYRNYANNNSALSKNLEKLSSGYRINRAGDDAAGLAISEKMRAQISGLDQAQSNAKSGVNLVQTAEGALTEVHDMLNRMTTLANQSANGTYDNTTDRANLQKEVDQLKSEINRIADSTNFNGINLLDGKSLSGKLSVEDVKYDTVSTIDGVTVGDVSDGGGSKGEFTIDISKMFSEGDSLTIKLSDNSTKVFNFKNGGTAATDFGGDTLEKQAESLAGKMTTALGGDFKVSTDGTKITLTSQEEGTGKLSISGVSTTNANVSAAADLTGTVAGKNNDTTQVAYKGVLAVNGSSANAGNVNVGDEVTFTFTDGNGKDLKATITVTDNMWDSDNNTFTTEFATALSKTKFTDNTNTTGVDENTLTVGDLFTITPNLDKAGNAAAGSIQVEAKAAGAVSGGFVAKDVTINNKQTGNTVTVTAVASDNVTAAPGSGGAKSKITLNGTGTNNFTKGDKVKFGGTLSNGSTFEVELTAGVDFDIDSAGLSNTMTNIANALKSDKTTITLTNADRTTSKVSGSDLFGANGEFTIDTTTTAGKLAIESNRVGTAASHTASEITSVSVTPLDAAEVTLNKSPAQAKTAASSSFQVDEKLSYGSAIKVGDKTYEIVADARDTSSRNNTAIVVSDPTDKKAVAKALADAISANESGYTATSTSDGTVTVKSDEVGSSQKALGISTPYGDKVKTASFKFDTGTVKEGSTMKANGNTYEFVKKGETASTEGAIAIEVDDFSKATAKDLADAFAGSIKNGTASVAEDGTITLKSSEVDGKIADPSVSFANNLTLQIGDTSDSYNQLTVDLGDMHASAMGISDVDIGTQEGAQAAVDVIKDAINYVSNVRGDLGAIQNRLEHTMNNLSVMSENITDAESNIRDTDVASEMMKYTKNNILIQSAQAMLAQANQTPQGVLQLLQ